MPPGALCPANFNKVGKEVRLNGILLLHGLACSAGFTTLPYIGNSMLLKLHSGKRAGGTTVPAWSAWVKTNSELRVWEQVYWTLKHVLRLVVGTCEQCLILQEQCRSSKKYRTTSSLYIYPLDRWTQLRWKGFEQIITWAQKRLFCLREGMTNNLGLNLRQSSLYNKNTLQLKMANWLRVTLTESQPVN